MRKLKKYEKDYVERYYDNVNAEVDRTKFKLSGLMKAKKKIRGFV